jgi:hypothetical protein
MDTGDIVGMAMVFSLVVVPALGLTARFVLKPVVDALVRLKEGGVIMSGGARPAEDVLQLREEVRQMRDDMAVLHTALLEIRDASEFHRALRDPSVQPAALPPAEA